MEHVSGFALRRLGVLSALIALVASILVVPAQQAAFGSTDVGVKTCSGSGNFPIFSGGSGTSADPYLIASADNLESLSNCVSMGTTDFLTKHYKQTADILWPGDKAPIGKKATPFSATYDGDGHTIYGFTQTRDSSDKEAFGALYSGLFGFGARCTINNLNVSGTVSVTGRAGEIESYSGILMGMSEGCTIQNVSTFGALTVDQLPQDEGVTTNTPAGRAGGILGFATRSTSPTPSLETVLENSTSHVDIAATGVRYVGGAVGYLYQLLGTFRNVSASPATDPFDSNVTRGKITLTSSPKINGMYIGGLIGEVPGASTIEQSWSSIPINAPSAGGQVQDVGNSSKAFYIGGLIGSATGDWKGARLDKSFSSSPVKLDLTAGTASIMVGGLIGTLHASATSEIHDSYSTSALEVNHSTVGASHYTTLGGLIGSSTATRPELDNRILNTFFKGTLKWPKHPVIQYASVSGFVGRWKENASLANSYANEQVASSALLTADQFKTVGSFPSWDFDDVWLMGEHHPVHQWANPDVTAPSLSSSTPVADATEVIVSDSVILTFNESIAKGSGNIRVYSGPTCSTLEQTIAVGNSRVSVSGSAATISFASPNQLPYGLKTCIEMDSGAITDLALNAFAGLTNPSAVSFTTENAPLTVANAPALTSVTAGNGQLTVAFTQGSDGGASITNYKYSTDGTSYTALDPAQSSSPVTITGLTNGVSYTVYLKAVNSVGDSVASNQVSGSPVAPTPTPTPSASPSETPTPSASPSATPSPAPAPAPTPTTLVPATSPRPSPSPSVVPSPTAAPSPTPTEDAALPAAANPAPPNNPPASPGEFVLSSDVLFVGTLFMETDTQELVMPAAVLRDIAISLAPDGATIDEGSLLIQSGRNIVPVILLDIGEVRLMASDMGSTIVFTLNIPGFESNSMTVSVQKQELTSALQLAMLSIAAVITALFAWWFFVLLRRRNNKSNSGNRGIRVARTA